MEHNKFNLKVGDNAILDYGYAQQMNVRIVYITKYGLFCDVVLAEQEGEEPKISVLTSRLTPNG